MSSHKRKHPEDLITRLLDVAKTHAITECGYEHEESPISKIHPEFARNLSATLRYIAWKVPYSAKKTTRSWGSYSLKHDVERSIGTYVSNGTALMAFHLLDFNVHKSILNGSIACTAWRSKKDYMLVSSGKKPPSAAAQNVAVHYITCATKCKMPSSLISIVVAYLDFTVKVKAPPTFVYTAFQLADAIAREL